MLNYKLLASSDLEYIPVAPASELFPGERIFLDIDGQPIVIFNIAGGYYAIADLCSHDNGPVGEGELENFEIICPRHGARFDVTSGKVLSLPAVEDIPAYPVRITDGMIEIGYPLAA